MIKSQPTRGRGRGEGNKINKPTHLPVILAIVDLDRYPIHELASTTGRKFLQHCRHDMHHTGSCNLTGFIRQDALPQLTAETNALLPLTSEQYMNRTIYVGPVDRSVPPEHPLRRRFAYRRRQLASDQIAGTTALRQLYDCDLLTDFIAAVQEKPKLFPMADEFQALDLIVLERGEWQPWHFDFNECTVTLLIQAPEHGGEFIFVPDIRSADDENHAGIQTFLDGEQSALKTLRRAPGTLTLFRGEYALHAVSRVVGARPRISAILTYDESPERVAPDSTNIQIYGSRVEKILKERRTNRV